MTDFEKVLNGWRIYLLNIDDAPHHPKELIPTDWDDDMFIAESERQGNVHSFEGFEEAFNQSDFNVDYFYIRIIKIDKDESNNTN